MTREAVDLVAALSTARRAAHLYPQTHPSYVEAIASFTNAVSACVAARPCTLAVYAGRLYHENAPLPLDVPAVRSLAETFESHNVESVTFHPDVAQHELVALLEALSAKPEAGYDLAAELERAGVVGVTIGVIADEDAQKAEERNRKKEQDRALYHRLLALMQRLSEQVARRGEPDLEQAGILVEGVLARLMEDSAAVLGLTTIASASEPSLFHAINTMAYALVMGAELGIPEEGLASLGIAALLHDIGKVPFDLTDPEQAQRAEVLHPSLGAEILSRLPDADRTPMLVAYEHHMGVDGSGHPDREAGYVTHPYSRLVAIANRYDHLVTPKPHGLGLSRDRAVIQVLREGGASLDPMFTRLLAKAFGVFPVGCVVRLSDQSVGVVIAPGPSPLTPRIQLLFEPDGTETERGRTLELAGSGLDIVEVLDPRSLALDVFERL
ncbi:HD domain-containing protein [Coriobacteriia bacterium Es71-Z0120]|uniref:HD-GYP domain-containing protein n=1 Tax=Parvivirga hydrogeniphila TaxID=2939460 RepID=UPI002260B0AF|nr:HD domain-containing phosphohydrolase [Parvivirga hydrogeniphila]MCL4078218.1 HD domain-containing protein [Parvivirga hydrogeniphila]